MSEYVQLYMKRSLENLPPLYLKGGFGIHTHMEGQEDVWEGIIEKAFGAKFSFQKWLVPLGNYRPEYVIYVNYKGYDIATAMGTENPKFPGEGWLRMVGTLPEASGKGAGRLAVLAVMHSLAGRGYKNIILSTDDYRLPALAMYKSLGFEPMMTDESHEERWSRVEEQLKK